MSWTEYDPNNGLRETNVFDEESNAFVVHKEQDVSDLLSRNADAANTGAGDAGIKRGLWHYASVPLVTQYELLTKYGLNIQNRNHLARVIDVINRDYPKLKTTHKHHSLKRNG